MLPVSIGVDFRIIIILLLFKVVLDESNSNVDIFSILLCPICIMIYLKYINTAA